MIKYQYKTDVAKDGRRIMKKLLYGNNIEKICKNCSHSKGRFSEGKVECDIKGSVSAESHCRKFDYDPMLRQPKKKPILQKMSEEDFKL